MAKRPCLDCGVPSPNTRCSSCTKQRKQIRNAHAPAARNLVAAWIGQHGYWCPGWHREPHEATDLTADHSTPLASGSTRPPDAVLCRSCNSAKQDR